MTSTVTIVGGGLAGLIAATEVAEAGVPVRVLEARAHIGGRASTAPAPYLANLGPHALYTGTALWEWLRDHGLHRPVRLPLDPRIKFRWQGNLRALPPRPLLAALPALLGRRGGNGDAPIDVDLRTWATDRWGPEAAQAMAGLGGPLTFDYDPGRLSAAFVVERIRRILLAPTPTPRYVAGGWSALVDRVGAHAERLGVEIETGAAVDSHHLGELADRGPVILAVAPGAARRLLGEDIVAADARRVALVDVAIDRQRPNPYLVMDLDEAIFVTRTTAVVASLAPQGQDLIQVSGGMTPGEDLHHAERRLQAVLELGHPGWSDRQRWYRRAGMREATGAIDLPGRTWRDRPAVDRGDGIWLAGDWVAAPGHLAEVSANSALAAARGAVHRWQTSMRASAGAAAPVA